jgi:hypothetical protein
METIHPLDGHTRNSRAGEMKRAWGKASSPLFAVYFPWSDWQRTCDFRKTGGCAIRGTGVEALVS